MSVLVAVAQTGAFLLLALVLLLFSRLALERALGFAIDAALFEDDNPAVALVAAGYYGGVAAIVWSALGGAAATWLDDLIATGLFGGFGVLLLALGVKLGGRLLLPGMNTGDELTRDRNAGAGIVLGAAALASGLVAAGAIAGQAPGGLLGGVLSAAGSFVVGLASLGLLTRLYPRVVGFDVRAEIQNDNAAAGCALGGALLGNGILLGWGVSGDFDPRALGASLRPLGVALAAGLLLMPAARFVVSRLFFGGMPFEAEIRRDRNLAAGIVDLFAHTLLAILLVRVLA